MFVVSQHLPLAGKGSGNTEGKQRTGKAVRLWGDGAWEKDREGPAELARLYMGSLRSVPSPVESPAPLRSSPPFLSRGPSTWLAALQAWAQLVAGAPRRESMSRASMAPPKRVGCSDGQSTVLSPESPLPWVLPKPPCRFPLAPSWLL